MREASERFWAKVAKGASCWIWLGGVLDTGYGQFHVSGSKEKGTQKRQGAHKFAYESFNGPVPDNMVLDHLCRNRLCVNPAHLEPVVHRDNVRRGKRGPLRPHCPTCSCDLSRASSL